jgi:biotin carboxylase
MSDTTRVSVAVEPGASRRPRLALVDDGTFPPMEVARVTAGDCEIVWVLDTTRPGVREMLRVFGRFGAGVVDIAGLSHDEAAAALADHQPTAILAQSDDRLVWAAEIAGRLGLPHMSPAVARRATDKLLQRIALGEHGLAVPGFWPVPADAEGPAWEAFVAAARFPGVLKPRRAWASRDIVAVRSLQDLRSALEALPAPRRDDMLLEEYLEDRVDHGGEAFAGYVSVESLVSGGRISHLAVSGRTPLAEPFRETGAFIPAALEHDDLAAILEVATAAAEAIGIETGFLHTEIKLTPDGPRVIEVNGRRGGSLGKLLPLATGVELIPLIVRVTLGEPIVFDQLLPTRGVAFRLRRYAPVDAQTILGIDGLERWRRERPDDEITITRGPGDPVDWRRGGDDRVLLVIGTATDHAELAELAVRLRTDIVIHTA